MRVPLAKSAALAATAVVLAALLVHGWHAIRTACYVDVVTGVWLALADDLRHGVFYRPLAAPGGYGGTRYFPLFFASISALMGMGAGALAAGFAVSLSGAAVLVTGLRRLLSGFGSTPALAWAGALLVLAPQFSQQALFAIRSDLLAAGLVVWGLVCARPLFDEGPSRTAPLIASSACFVLAAATKITSLYGPASVVVALLVVGRARPAIRLALGVGGGAALMVAGVTAASGGRALESWRVCASAGVSVGEWARLLPSAVLFELLLPSRTFMVMLAVATVAWLDLACCLRAYRRRPDVAFAVRHGWASPRAGLDVASLALLPAALAATAVIVASPGAIFTNQLVDGLAASIVVVFAAAGRRRLEPALAVGLLAFSVVAGMRTVWPVVDGSHAQGDRQRRAAQLELVRGLAAWPGPVFAESPEWPIQAGVRPYLLDPFALRVVALARPDILGDVLRAFDERRFSAVLLGYDPLTPRGRGLYTHLNLGWPITSRILANYELQATVGGVRVYRPRRAGGATPEPDRP